MQQCTCPLKATLMDRYKRGVELLSVHQQKYPKYKCYD